MKMVVTLTVIILMLFFLYLIGSNMIVIMT